MISTPSTAARVGLLVVLVACGPGSPEDTGARDPVVPPAPPTACEGVFDERRATIDDVAVSCASKDTIRYVAEVDGWAAHGDVYLLETGAEPPHVLTRDLLRQERHVLSSVAHGECGAWDQLEHELAVVPVEEAPVRDASTHFGCADLEEGLVTAVFTIVDTAGAVSDCAIVGHDPVGLQEGDYDEWVAAANQADWSDCLLLVGFR